ncbi:uncharacterized protein LOC102672083 [Apis dorsata]|uniref:uncharacterized protein LOC102672083 n=1 Tax=Apis dorsata TaxID=7462 RepID=UPI0003DF4B04|nr:uncharacterized protein LOC102672083 [Apis dorsata]XP_031369458.1 uncharacterized protein LOC102672083 [Apis dorsata]
MAVTNDAMYQSRIIAPSFVSSNMYYGCVQHCKKETQHNVMLEHIGISKPSLIDCCSYDTLMEIDEDGCDYSMTSDYLNNDSIILKATVQNRLKSDKLQSQQQTTYDADMLQHRSRKRHNSDFNPTSQLKKLRRGGGKDHVHEDTTSAKDYGSTITSCESEAFQVNIIDNNVQQSMIKNKNWAANSYINLNNSNCEELLFNDSHKSLENIVEYENMLFETHGCSIYQFYRLQLDNNDCTEF